MRTQPPAHPLAIGYTRRILPIAPSPLRLDGELTRSAAEVARRMSRSVAEQIAHWARIGRELERAADVSVPAIRAVLDGAASYDALPPMEQAIVRAAWDERMTELRDSLRLDLDLAAAGIAYAELDADGNVVVREPAAPAVRAKRTRVRRGTRARSTRVARSASR